MEKESIVRVSVPPRDYSFMLTTMPHIVKLILRKLAICDLLRCKLVCSLWEDIVNQITRGKIYILSQEIKLRHLKKAIEKPEIMLRHLKLSRNTDVQLITEFSNNLAKKCSICYQEDNFWPILSEHNDLTHYRTFSLSQKNEILFNCSLDCKHPADIAIFPNLPGVQMIRFSYHRSEVKSGILSVAEKLRLPKEDLKCVIWFTSDSVKELFTRNQEYAVAGIQNIHLDQYINIGYAFHGSRVKAASMNLCKTFNYNEDYSLHPSFSEIHIQALQKYNIDQKKCIAFMFSQYHKQCCKNHTLLLFRQSFPDVPVMYYRCNRYFGKDFMPGMKTFMPDRYMNFKVATLVLVWYD